jgi:hypothetical protein
MPPAADLRHLSLAAFSGSMVVAKRRGCVAIYNFMDISTGHLTDGDVALLNEEDLPFTVMTYEYGWIVSTSLLMSADLVEEAVKELSAAGLSPEFIAAARTAGERGCWLLRFDADADLEGDLPIGGYGLDPDESPLSGIRTSS